MVIICDGGGWILGTQDDTTLQIPSKRGPDHLF